jgi:hypothetical protein
VTYETVRELGLVLPGVEETTSYGTPALKVRGKGFTRLKEDYETLVLRTDFLEREHLLRTAPEVFYVTDHYRDYPWVLVRLPHVERAQLGELLADAWRRVAPRRLIAEYDAAKSPVKPAAEATDDAGGTARRKRASGVARSSRKR